MLTDLAVRKAVARDKLYKLSDGGGLYLLVTKAGQRYWRVDYRFGEKRALRHSEFTRPSHWPRRGPSGGRSRSRSPMA